MCMFIHNACNQVPVTNHHVYFFIFLFAHRHNAVFKDVYREVGMLEVFVTCLTRYHELLKGRTEVDEEKKGLFSEFVEVCCSCDGALMIWDRPIVMQDRDERIYLKAELMVIKVFNPLTTGAF